ncbi:hypothetical protein AUP42_15570 [Thalassospira lucentensis]|jgi:hypothetical protein|uniref:DUF3108 domain-containing protein n=2 Tax=Thalassospira TaxID=168934 RepID=A0A154L8C7_9PROT|nr:MULTISPECIES: DUF6134 family protein [Thalassospira]KZB52519.1 hypothetical protein AUP41_04135 [Thalassospira xiamenensis]KZB66941.1 hypothetical protein AUP42_15570 [Thalassospira lucentensis]MAZ33616.1 hypothetical protein [Thalassospira sp.]MCK2168256.1 DUF6134 family protein [Thalassospira xiamenensis]RCK51501.1 hypothetical protein TH44_08185 [Thalassospira xiamenensis]
MRHSFIKSTVLCTLAAGLIGSLGAISSAHADETLNYQVLKDGEPIGFETVEITDTPDGYTAAITTRTDVKVLFLQFQYGHSRLEKWRNDQLVSVDTDTNDDGSPYTYKAEYEGDCFEVAGKGVAKRDACDGAWPLTLWREDVTTKTSLYSVINAEPYAVTTRKTGTETLAINNREIPATHYVMTGDVQRDLWYGDDGRLLKTSFKRKGYDIDFIRVDAKDLQK